MNNKYYKWSKIYETKFRQLIRYFAIGFTATDSAELTGLSGSLVTTIFRRLPHKIASWSEQQARVAETIEVDESYFGPKLISSKRGRGVSGKTIGRGIFKRQVKVYTEIVPNARKKDAAARHSRKTPASVIHSDGWRGYEGLVSARHDKHYRIQHGQDEFAHSTSHINGIESPAEFC